MGRAPDRGLREPEPGGASTWPPTDRLLKRPVVGVPSSMPAVDRSRSDQSPLALGGQADVFSSDDVRPWLVRDRDSQSYQPSRPRRTSRQRARTVPRLWLHLLIVVVCLTVVLGQGFWDRSAQITSDRPQTPASALRLGELPTGPRLANLSSSSPLLSNNTDILSGYVSQLASAVAPDHLNVQLVIATGDESLADLAEAAGRSIETLLWANGFPDPDTMLAAGTQIRIPPADGMLHVVQEGDTLEDIAQRYQVEPDRITGFEPNGVKTDTDLVPGHLIMIPGGIMPARDQVVVYIVRDGDTLATISQFFGLHPKTIVWANNLPDGNLIFSGQQLAILPADGVMVTAKQDDTIQALADTFNVDPAVIRDHPLNGLGIGGQLRTGQQVMIAGGVPDRPLPPVSVPDSAPQVAEPVPGRATLAAAGEIAYGASGSFIWPTAGVITQYYGPTSFWMEPAYLGYANFHQGLDLANDAYTSIVAADGGQVVFAGWSTVGYGYAVSIDHGNGFVSWYGHMAEPPSVWVGQQVFQGQYLGPMGTTGASTGEHLHFGLLRGGSWVDPVSYLQ